LGLNSKVTSKKEDIINCDSIILPGVGAFSDAYNKLDATCLIDVIKSEVKKGKPLLGICLGMQLLFDRSFEYGESKGLGLIKGDICSVRDDINCDLKVPHMGWNSLKIVKENSLLKYINCGDYVYYVHSYYAKNCQDAIIATSSYGQEITGAVANKNVFGTQFHPEKSGKTGLNILKAFAEIGDKK
jgi:glutamine amidotransferase